MEHNEFVDYVLASECLGSVTVEFCHLPRAQYRRDRQMDGYSLMTVSSSQALHVVMLTHTDVIICD